MFVAVQLENLLFSTLMIGALAILEKLILQSDNLNFIKYYFNIIIKIGFLFGHR